jgi:excisionase family DNA binding protein
MKSLGFGIGEVFVAE